MADVFLPYTQGQLQAGQLAGQQLSQLQGVLGLQRGMQEMQDQQALRGVLAQTGGDLDKAAGVLAQMGQIGAVQKIAQAQQQMAHGQLYQGQLGKLKREQAFYSPENMQQFMEPTPGVRATDPLTGLDAGTPSGPPALNFDRMLNAGAASGVINPEALMNHRNQQQARVDALQARLYDIQVRSQDRQASEQTRRDLAAQADATRRELAYAQMQNAAAMRSMAAGLRQPPIVQTQNGIYERGPGGLVQLTDPNTGQPLRPLSMTGGNYERGVSKDFESHPAVKAFVDLTPDVNVVNNYMEQRPTATPAQRAVNDKNLVNTFLRVTHPKGDQISNFERKDMAGMPAFGPRVQQAIEGFFNGRYVPDDVAGQMQSVINQKYAERGAQVQQIENKFRDDVRRQGGNPDAIRQVAPRGGSTSGQSFKTPGGATITMD